MCVCLCEVGGGNDRGEDECCLYMKVSEGCVFVCAYICDCVCVIKGRIAADHRERAGVMK